jgi:ribosome-binding factor A
MELVPEALSELNDSRINSITITAIDCKQGKYDATVYYDATDFEDRELPGINSALTKASGHIKSYCLGATGWYKCPNFKFVADKSLEKSNRIDELFEKIKKEAK